MRMMLISATVMGNTISAAQNTASVITSVGGERKAINDVTSELPSLHSSMDASTQILAEYPMHTAQVSPSAECPMHTAQVSPPAECPMHTAQVSPPAECPMHNKNDQQVMFF